MCDGSMEKNLEPFSTQWAFLVRLLRLFSKKRIAYELLS